MYRLFKFVKTRFEIFSLINKFAFCLIIFNQIFSSLYLFNLCCFIDIINLFVDVDNAILITSW